MEANPLSISSEPARFIIFTLAINDILWWPTNSKAAEIGPAQNLHGATYEVTTEYRAEELTSSGIVLDVGLAQSALKSVIESLNYKNLDEVAKLKDVNRTMKILARHIHGELKESPVASCSFEAGI